MAGSIFNLNSTDRKSDPIEFDLAGAAKADDETMKSPSIEIGDKFIKPEVPDIVWVVERLVDLSGLPPHAELRVQGNPNRMMMMSQEALSDHHLFHRIEDG